MHKNAVLLFQYKYTTRSFKNDLFPLTCPVSHKTYYTRLSTHANTTHNQLLSPTSGGRVTAAQVGEVDTTGLIGQNRSTALVMQSCELSTNIPQVQLEILSPSLFCSESSQILAISHNTSHVPLSTHPAAGMLAVSLLQADCMRTS
jgi:hypothetical protein